MSVFWWIATKDNEQYVVVKLYKQAVSEEVPSVTMSFLMHALELKLQFCWIINLFYHVPRKYIKLGKAFDIELFLLASVFICNE